MRLLLRLADKALQLLVVILFSGIVLVTVFQVVSRYLFNHPFMWTEELARYLFVWSVLLAAGLGINQGLHISVDYLVGKLPPKIKLIIQSLTYGLIVVFGGVLVIVGWEVVEKVVATPSPSLRISMGLVYAAIPIGALVMIGNGLYGCFRLWKPLVLNAPDDNNNQILRRNKKC